MAYSDFEKAEAFKDTLEVTFQENVEPYCDDKIEEVENVVCNYFDNFTTLTPPLTSPIEVRGIIKRLQNRKAAGRNSPLSLENKVILYKQVLRPIITYASPVWGAAAATHMKKIQVIQNKILRLITNAPWEKIWPACVTDNTTTQTSALSDEIINLAHEIRGDGFNTFSHDDIDELLVDDALSDNDIIDLTLDLTVDGVVGLEGDNDEEEKSTPLTGKLIQEGLQLCSKLENHFLINDPNSERASKLQRELQNCMSGYRELYKKIKESSSQILITDYIVRKGRATQNENEVCENPWPLPQISIAETVSSNDEGDLEPLRKRCKPSSDSDND
ncbi:uncharacterized protein TNCV_1851041 [Trichonephila clavipes]|nr:uncharacterized protein TNCV_1851041 [Trichonephila clavipes]